MNPKFLLGVCVGAFVFCSCQKNLTEKADLTTRPLDKNTAAAAASSDALDAILKDLPPSTYLLKFDNTLPVNPYITRKVYGTLSENTLVPISKFGIRGLESIGYTLWPPRKIPFPTGPTTCPDMLLRADIAQRVVDLLKNVNKNWYDMTAVEVTQGQFVIGTAGYFKAASLTQPDVIDKNVIGQTALKNFRLILPDATKYSGFQRRDYGSFDIASRSASGDTYENIIGRIYPNSIGCFYPLDVSVLRYNLEKNYPGQFKFNVTQLPGGGEAFGE
ncbi:MAG TPA: hypothetical protein VM802_07290 [Chitinophaga sp.]|uniref:hypothetical protein n=1 Tax=Chitinophaga sp. TaxID=1869181 RepID=UPI002B6F8FE0|nr:hypothetical protein [Chitinophaga sp.]HVI44655.1 hypothetical protein [Chitinophaga sp.]